MHRSHDLTGGQCSVLGACNGETCRPQSLLYGRCKSASCTDVEGIYEYSIALLSPHLFEQLPASHPHHDHTAAWQIAHSTTRSYLAILNRDIRDVKPRRTQGSAMANLKVWCNLVQATASQWSPESDGLTTFPSRAGKDTLRRLKPVPVPEIF